MGNLPDDFMFSQSSLQDYEACPRRFELKYILKQRFPAAEVDDMLEFERRMEQGQNFHLLVHQHLLGIPENILEARIQDNELGEWFQVYLDGGLQDVPPKRYPEKTLTIPLGEFGLLAKVDLLAVDDERIQIIDWKTSRHVPKAKKLETRWQTRVYLCVIAKGAEYLVQGDVIHPEQIEMIYWYAANDGVTRKITYTQEQLERDEADLLQLVDDIDKTRTFPLTDDERQCRFCTYRSLCDRGDAAGSLDEWDDDDFANEDFEDFSIDFDQIGEIAF